MKQFALLCFVLAIYGAVCANAKCTRRTIHVNSSFALFKAAQNATPGDDIVVAPGNYDDGSDSDFAIYSSGEEDCPISISCEESGSVLLSGDISFMRENSYWEISNITLKSYHFTTLGGWNCHHISFTNVHFFNSPKNLAYLENCQNFTIHNCTFDTCGDYAISLHGGGVLVENSFFGDRIGIGAVLIDGVRNSHVIRSNTFYGSGFSYSSFPYWMELKSGGCEVSNNHFMNTGNRKMAGGVSVMGDDVSDNIFKENFMVLNEGAQGFNTVVARNQKVCASNKVVGGGVLTTGKIDPSC